MIRLGMLGGVRVVYDKKGDGRLESQAVVLKVGAYARELRELMEALRKGQELEVHLENINPPLPLRFNKEAQMEQGESANQLPY